VNLAIPGLRPHPRNDLELRVRCDVLDLVDDVHVPVDSGRADLAAAGLDQHLRLAGRVDLVVAEVIEDLELRSPELLGQWQFSQVLLRRSQVRDG